MTRKDYILLAEALRVQYHNAKFATNADIELDAPALLYQGRLDGIDFAAREIADALQRDNGRFNREHFLAVVRGEKDLHSRPSRNRRES